MEGDEESDVSYDDETDGDSMEYDPSVIYSSKSKQQPLPLGGRVSLLFSFKEILSLLQLTFPNY